MNQIKNANIALITFPIGDSGRIPLSNMVRILQFFFDEIFVVTGNAGSDLFSESNQVRIYNIKHKSGKYLFNRILKYIITQLKTSYKIIKLAKNVDCFIFFIGAEKLLLPVIAVKILNKKIVLLPSDFTPMFTKKVTSRILNTIARFNHALSNKIILYSPNIIKEWKLEKYRSKILIASRHFLDFDNFRIEKRFDKRDDLIGYIGRTSREKGILKFIELIPELLKEDLEVLIGGNGPLQNKIEEYLEGNNLKDRVKLTGWISHDKLPEYLNDLKLLILPSYTEGLPNIMLEAMACGTPVLATSVGGIPDVIRDGVTGFILEDNSPECIAKNIKNALNDPNLKQIIKNARDLVEKEFTYTAAVKRFEKIINEI